ncbi:hypothetical protein CJD36_015580 [Flavipsychrobacter stenotrophus]|uniref:Uncharacterized protein n=1 Tax=Flavipsychrobacter stenotrophus TaxID=2077091 RepID=A0A2S7SUA9_9BACT|nr:hypothetical protein [Flavipsychrobacter stenotrophus]PQJ10116.1 hypothetical protein CJD36_015580 [Flavipsychrobacter stenotrophus]
MSLSFRGGVLIQHDADNYLAVGYDYLEEYNHFVIEYSLHNKKFFQQEVEYNYLCIKKQANGEWKIGSVINDCFYKTNVESLKELEKYIVLEHCRFGRVNAGNKAMFHNYMKDFRKIA